MSGKIKQPMFGRTAKQNRQPYFDMLRVIATIFVIGVHTVSLAATMVSYKSLSFMVLEIFDFLFLCCNLLFIMISGALLLPVKGEKWYVFFRKRFSKVVIPMVIYYILYICAKEGIAWIYPNHWMAMLQRILSGPPEEAPHFWLVYVIIWLYVLTPFLRWIISHIPNTVLRGLIAVIFVVCSVDTYLPLFGIASPLGNVVDSFAGVFLLGYFLAQKASKREEDVFLTAGVVSFLLSCVLIVTTNEYPDYIYQNAPTMMLYSSAIFILIKRTCNSSPKSSVIAAFTSLISRYSYSILLIHWGVLHFVVKQLLHVNVLSGGIWGGCILMMVLTLLISLSGAVILDNTLIKWAEQVFLGKKVIK